MNRPISTGGIAVTKLLEVLDQFDQVLNQVAPGVATRLQPGLTRAEIDQAIAKFPWTLPQDGYALYQWHNGLARQPGNLNLIEKLLRQKGKWHGGLAGRENELRLNNGERLLTAKFLPLSYALAGHRHLKLGKCLLKLLPVFLLNDGTTMRYCMLRLDTEPSVVYCANGTKLPPMGVTETFLSKQIQLSLIDLASLLTTFCQRAIQPISESQGLPPEADYDLNSEQFDQIYQRYRSELR